jgi:tyrosyl-tRNA synthetase
MNFKSQFLQELKWRGFISQITHPEELDQILAKEKITAYVGFDCTAKSLHAGSLIQIMMLRIMQKYGHKPIALLGGGTTKIGDPTGKDEARKILSNEEINQNLIGIKDNLSKFINFGSDTNSAIMLNNNDWLANLNYVDFLCDVGRYFSINRMMSFDSVKLRLEREQNLSFLEFNYMILQAYDFYILNQKYNCVLQFGGSDQWGNIVNGVELIRRLKISDDKKNSTQTSGQAFGQAFGLTSILITTADGKKMGKTANGAVWLDDEMLSPYDYFQYFRNIADADVEKFLKLFTDLQETEISKLASLKDQEINKAKEILAFEVTKICHGNKKAELALQKAREIFVSKSNDAYEIKEIMLDSTQIENGIRLADIIFITNAAPSKSEAKKLIKAGAIKINDQKIIDEHFNMTNFEPFDLAIGKKRFFKILLKTNQ